MLLAISESSQVAAARRSAAAIGKEQGLSEEEIGRVALVATEIATNILKHASAGHMIVQPFADAEGSGVELLGFDKGTGIGDLRRSLEDGYSTVGTPGTGLGAMKRQADILDIYSRAGLGTAVLARISAKSPLPPGSVTIGAVVSPHPHEVECGDAWAFRQGSRGATMLAVDGSGHGPQAALAARTAVAAFEGNFENEGVRLVDTIHRALLPTRGAAVAVARIDREARLVRFTGVGNIAGALIDDDKPKHMVSHNGTAGHVAARIREFNYPFAGRVTVILHSDGLSAKWDLTAYPGLAAHHPSIIAGVLFRDYRRANDDAMITVMRDRA